MKIGQFKAILLYEIYSNFLKILEIQECFWIFVSSINILKNSQHWFISKMLRICKVWKSLSVLISMLCVLLEVLQMICTFRRSFEFIFISLKNSISKYNALKLGFEKFLNEFWWREHYVMYYILVMLLITLESLQLQELKIHLVRKF